MHTFHQHVGSNQHLFVGIAKYGAIITNTFFGAVVLYLYVFCQSVYQTKFS